MSGNRGATVELRGVTKRYAAAGARDGAVKDLSLSVPAGTICVLVGPSGCGKTTTLKMINRLVEPTAGRIFIDGVDIASVELVALRRSIGYVIQQIGLFPHQTVGENVGTVPRLLGWPSSRIRARVDELLALVGLDPVRMRDRYPAKLSGGERQRVGVARALAAEPPLILMDEPFGAVDPLVRERLQDDLLRIQRGQGITVLFVTHDIDEAIKIGDQVALLRDGRLVQSAPPAEMLRAPADDFVARFVGADRGLKRLALRTVAGLPLGEAVLLRSGDPAPGAGHALLLDAARRPLGWVSAARVRSGMPVVAEHADPSSPFFTLSTRLRDALSALLASSVQTGVVVDDGGVYLGTLSLTQLTDALREPT